MFDTLQTSLIPYIKETKKIEPIAKPAIIIPINIEAKTGLGKTKEIATTPALSFEKWNLPVQEEGYIKGSRYDFL